MSLIAKISEVVKTIGTDIKSLKRTQHNLDNIAVKKLQLVMQATGGLTRQNKIRHGLNRHQILSYQVLIHCDDRIAYDNCNVGGYHFWTTLDDHELTIYSPLQSGNLIDKTASILIIYQNAD